MKYITELLVNAQPQVVFDALHQYKRERNTNAFFLWLFLGTIIKMDFRVLTENVVGLGVTYDWKFRLFGYPIFAFQEQIVEWEEGTTVSYHDASTAPTIHTGEPFFRTFHHIVAQSFQFPLETPSHGRQCLRTAEKMSEP